MDEETYVIENAGLVLLWPFLGRYFEKLQLLNDNGDAFRDAAALNRAIHLSQFLVTAQSETAETSLYLNKLMCGADLSMPVSTGIEMTRVETTLATALLATVNVEWRVLSDTTVEGLREAFLIRAGALRKDDFGWSVTAAKAPCDLLLGSLPWSLSKIQLAWMPEPLTVEWPI